MSSIISGTEARKLIEDHNAVLIDVRNPPEFASGTAPGATNIPVNSIPHIAGQHDPEQHLIVFCLSGARSSMAHMILKSMGFENVSNVGTLQNFVNS
ncbi:MAG: rhodanese-like domain-containing protein [Gammaproteobacteria bacterium]|nr:rhodanese-like domain-containing protein [Gammaproteobacteria bacterium]